MKHRLLGKCIDQTLHASYCHYLETCESFNLIPQYNFEDYVKSVMKYLRTYKSIQKEFNDRYNLEHVDEGSEN